jgi:hypothetical protein
MKHVARLIAGLTLLLGVASVVPACAHDDSTLFVRGVLAPPVAQAGAACAYSNDANNAYISSGTLDTAFLLTYQPTFLIGNQMKQQGNPDQVRTETSRITIDGAIIRITDSGGTELKNYTRFVASFADPASGSTPSYGVAVGVEILDADTVLPIQQQLAAGSPLSISPLSRRLISYIRFFGRTLGGQNVESDEFKFPIDICYGCLICATGAGCAPSTGAGQQVNLPCIAGQDQCVDCRLCSPNPTKTPCR